MTEIKVLDKSVFNRIAAGEVVERPCSIVKELIENSIDAGASSISVTVKGGGIEFIRVADNGKGINPSDIKTAFLPHATSKIQSVADLDRISTLGFRGEALPSIASVAKVTMSTRTPDSEFGYRYAVDNGIEKDFGEIGAPFGTSVTVENLFDRIPARKKFLARENVEENAITNLVARYILANYNIAFKYTVNDKNIYISAGTNIENAILTVYGNEYLQNMLKIHSTMSDISLTGFINKPAFSKHSKSFQTLIVNGRYVINDDISYTVFGCYQKYLMKRQYPTYILYLNLPYDLVDVNVHPNKMEVKFAIPSLIKKLVADTIKSQVLESVAIPKEIENFYPESHFQTYTSKYDNNADSAATVYKEDIISVLPNSTDNDSVKSFFGIQEKAEAPNQTNDKVNSAVLGEIPALKIKSRFSDLSETEFKENPDSSVGFLKTYFSSAEQIKINVPKRSKVAGKLFNTYILIEYDNSIILIDQHAAHEKLLYDRLLAEYNTQNIVTQSLLLPFDFSVSATESSFLSDNLENLKNIGFEVTQNDKNALNFSVKSIPACCTGINLKEFVGSFLSENIGNNKLPQAFLEELMQIACKAATKGEYDLSESEINSLLEQIDNETTELFCPHGRPIAITLKRSEIEKWFKRIV